MKMCWRPGEKVGPFGFGSQLSSLANDVVLEEVSEEFDPDVGWRVFRVIGNDNLRIYSEAGEIQAVACHEECSYLGVNLVGLTLGEFEDHLGQRHQEGPERIELDSGIQEVYEFDSIGAQLWLDRGVIVTLILSDAGS